MATFKQKVLSYVFTLWRVIFASIMFQAFPLKGNRRAPRVKCTRCCSKTSNHIYFFFTSLDLRSLWIAKRWSNAQHLFFWTEKTFLCLFTHSKHPGTIFAKTFKVTFLLWTVIFISHMCLSENFTKHFCQSCWRLHALEFIINIHLYN